MKTVERVIHPFAPVYNCSSSVLILGSFPSVKSRENGFYYGHPQNRFWKVLSAVLDCELPQTVEEKKSMLLCHRIALWDAAAQCEVTGSSDADITNVIPTDLGAILQSCDIRAIIANGRTAEKIYRQYQYPIYKREIVYLPSTSAANAAWSIERLAKQWQVILKYLSGQPCD